MKRRHRWLLFLLSTTVVNSVPIDRSTGLVAEGGEHRLSRPNLWYVTSRGGEKFTTPALSVTEAGCLFRAGENFRRLSGSELFSLMQTAVEPPELPADERVSRLFLSNGDCLIGRLQSLSETEVELTPLISASGSQPESSPSETTSQESDRENSTVLTVPLTSVKVLEWLTPGRSLRDQDKLIFPESENHDVLRLSNGDQLTGDLTTIALETLEFSDEQGTRTVPTSELRAIRFNPELLLEPPAVSRYHLVLLSDGTLLTARKFTPLNYNRFEIQTVLAGTYRIPLDRLVAVSSFSADRLPLSGRTPASVNYTPFLENVPSWQADRSVVGAPMQMAGGRYLTGIGMHSRTKITWELEKNDSRLLADIGLDDSTRGRGCVLFSVLLDGDVAFESGAVRGGESPQLIDIDLTGAGTLTLLVDFSEGGDVLDRANWGHAVIVQKAGDGDPGSD